MNTLPAAARDAVVTQLGVAAAGIGPRTLGSYTLNAATRQDLGSRIGTVADLDLVELSACGDVLSREVEARATAVDTQLRQVQALALAVENHDRQGDPTPASTTFDTRYFFCLVRHPVLELRYALLELQIRAMRSFDTRYADFDSRYTLLDSQLNQFDLRYGQFSSELSRFNTDLARSTRTGWRSTPA